MDRKKHPARPNLTPRERNLQIQTSQHELERKHAEKVEAIKSLVQHKGWRYVKEAGMAYVIQPYQCDPPKKGEDTTKWDTYCLLSWELEKLFGVVEQAARE